MLMIPRELPSFHASGSRSRVAFTLSDTLGPTSHMVGTHRPGFVKPPSTGQNRCGGDRGRPRAMFGNWGSVWHCRGCTDAAEMAYADRNSRYYTRRCGCDLSTERGRSENPRGCSSLALQAAGTVHVYREGREGLT